MDNCEGKRNKFDVILLFIIILFALRVFPFGVIGLRGKAAANIYYNGTYIISAILILLARKNLDKYNIDIVSIIFFILAPIILPYVHKFYAKGAKYLPEMDYPIIMITIGAIIIICLVLSRIRLMNDFKRTIFWVIISIIFGFAFNRLMRLYEPYVFGGTYTSNSLMVFLVNWLAELNRGSIMEEPLFRGFLWGYLKQLNVNENCILFIQAILFTIAHFAYIWLNYPSNIIMLIHIFVCGIIYGIFVKLSKSIAPAMIVHAFSIWT